MKHINENYKNKIIHLNVNVCKLFQTNPELIAFYRIDGSHLCSHFNVSRGGYTKITDQIFIGNDTYSYVMCEKDKLKNYFPINEATHIITVSMDAIKTYKIPVYADGFLQPIYEHFPINENEKNTEISKNTLFAVANRLHEIIQDNPNNKIYIHCSLGMNRSPAAVILYFMKFCNMSLFDAYKFIAKKRSIFTSNELFRILFQAEQEIISVTLNITENNKPTTLLHSWDNLKALIGFQKKNDVTQNSVSQLKLRTHYVDNFCHPNAYLYALYDIIYLENLHDQNFHVK